MPDLTTPRLRLRPYVIRDRQGFAALVSDPGVMAHLGGPASDPYALFERLRAHDPTLGEIAWAITLPDASDLAGHVFLQGVNQQSAEIGFVLLPSFHRQGLATEAAIAVLEYGFSHLGLLEIHASVDIHHTASHRVLRKAGMTLAGQEADSDGPYFVFKASAPRSSTTACSRTG